MRNKYLILIMPLLMILISGCGDKYKFAKDFQLTNINEGKVETSIELGGMDGLQLANGNSSDDYLIPRKYKYGNLTIYYRLLYQRNTIGYNLSPQRLTFLIDGQRHILTFSGSDKSDTSEWAWVIIEPVFLEKIANAKKVLLKIEGKDRDINYIFNKKYLYFFRRFYKECVLPDT